MLRYWWLWTILVTILCGLGTGLDFLSALILGTLTVCMSILLGVVVSSLQKKKCKGITTEVVLAFLVFVAMKKLSGTVYAIVFTVIGLGGAYLFAKHMAKKV